MNIAIIDADIIGKPKHRFPNLCCMKLSAFHKSQGDIVVLKLDYNNLDQYDKVYISKVFTDTEIPGEPSDKSLKTCENIINWYSTNDFLKQKNIIYGGTGFYYDKAPALPDEIEHIMPDYSLYDEWVALLKSKGVKQSELKYYTDYSIGYLTRGCFRGCYYCVNRNCKCSTQASQLNEFYDSSKPKICLLDDNFFSFPKWKELIEPIKNLKKPFQFKQGLDERLLTTDKILELSKWKYDGDMIFAFDNYKDKDIIVSKLKLIRTVVPKWRRTLKFYVFTGCDIKNKYSDDFFHRDIIELFERIKILISFNARPYVMRYETVYDTEYSSFYSAVASWCNQPSIFTKFTFRMFCKCRGMLSNGYSIYKRDIESYLKDIGKKGATWRAMEMIEEKFPDIAKEYFNMIGTR